MQPAALRELTLKRMVTFVTDVAVMLESLPANTTSKNIKNQLCRSSSSIGANFAESNSAESRNDFIHKLSIALKEAEESRFWIQCIEASNPDRTDIEKLFTECNEFVKILQSCISKSKRNRN